MSRNRSITYTFTAVAALAASYVWYRRYTNDKKIVLPPPTPFFVENTDWVPLNLVNIEKVSHDTSKFRFKFPDPEQTSGLNVASAIYTKYVTAKGNNVVRPYTPVNDNADRGYLDLVIKRYENGKMSKHIHDLKPSETLLFKGPIKKWEWKPNAFKEITLLGGGSGITPLWQMLYHIANNPNDKTKVHLIYANKTPKDILLKDSLDKLAATYPNKVKVSYFVDQLDNDMDYKGELGFISKEFIEKNVPKAGDIHHHVFICGPPGFMKCYTGEKKTPKEQGDVTGMLNELGFDSNNVFKF